jgi:choline dehydrogenase
LENYDFIVVGGGSAGCVVANRLSADPATRVCLIEAGPSDRAWPTRLKVNTPIGNPTLLGSPRFNWQHGFAGGARLLDRVIPCPRGRILGGSSAVNGMIYIRGHRSDYDHWAALGNPGWGFPDVLPFFTRHEHHERGADALHGTGGELNVAPIRQLHPASAAFVAGAEALQLRANEDFNGPEQDGFGVWEVTQKNGERWSSARAFLHPVMSRPNLTVLTDALATAIRFDGTRAVGLALRVVGQAREIGVTREIILSGGAINSPQLLMLSGIGPADALRALGISPVLDLPGVGQNLQDHAALPVTLHDPSRTAYAVTARRLPHLAREMLRYVATRHGTPASNAVESGGFIRTRPDLACPDIQIIFMAALKELGKSFPSRHGWLITPVLLRPNSRGQVTLVSADPADRPLLEPNFLDNADDLARLLAGVAVVRQILATPAFAPWRGAEILPGEAVRDHDALVDYAHRNVQTIYHPVGTCKMGPADDRLAVVDHLLRLRGVQGVRVADCSIMPTIVGGNTNAPAMMIGERCADFIGSA